jgi:hypothetical protein
MDYLEGEGNQTIVSETSQTLRVPIMMEIHCLFSVRKETPNFNEALDKTVDLWTSQECACRLEQN